MSDHGDVTTVYDLIDDAFAGAVDPRELISKMDDPADFHVPTNLKVKKRKVRTKPPIEAEAEIKKGMAAIANHRRLGAITSEQALAMFDDLIAKALEKPTEPKKKVADDAHVAAIASTWGASTRTETGDTADVRGPQPNPTGKKGQPIVKDEKEDPKVKQAKIERKVDEIVPKPKKIDPKLMEAQPPEPAFAGPMAAGPQPSAPQGPPVAGKGKPKEKVSKKDASRAETRTGQLLNGVAITGGVHAAALTGKNLIEDSKGVTQGRHMLAPKHAKLSTAEKVGARLKGSKMLKPITDNPKRAAMVAGGAWMGLHTAELAGDAIAARSLKRQASKPNTDLSKRADVEWNGVISKVNTDKRLVFGWCSISKVNGEPVVDLQGDYVPISTTEDAAYRYVIHSRKGGDMHERVSKRTGFNLERDEPLHTSDLVESMVFTAEKLEALGLPPNALPEAWWVGFKVNDDEQWRKVKSGERPGFSIHGSGARVPLTTGA